MVIASYLPALPSIDSQTRSVLKCKDRFFLHNEKILEMGFKIYKANVLVCPGSKVEIIVNIHFLESHSCPKMFINILVCSSPSMFTRISSQDTQLASSYKVRGFT